MEHRVNSQSTLTRQPPPQLAQMAPHSALPPHMQNEQMMNQMKLLNGGGGSPRGYNSMERSYPNQPPIPQGQGPPPSYAPSPFQYNSLQRNNPLQVQPGHPQMMQQMSMPAPTPPPPYGGTLTNPNIVNGNSMANVMIPQLTPQPSSASLQFAPQAAQPGGPMGAAGYPIEMQFPPGQMPGGLPQGNQQTPTQMPPGMMPGGQFGASAAYPPLPQPHQVQINQSSTLPLTTGSMQSVNSSLRSRSKSRGSKMMVLRVLLLDGTTPKFDLAMKATGGEFFQKVVDHLNLLETDYFGLQYAADHAGSVYWLEMQKPIYKQVKAPAGILFRFAVKFYTSEPGQLQDEYTKVLFALQIKRDMACGMLPCAENTAALMASYIVQAELGDFDVEKNSGIESSPRYLSMFKFIPPQTDEFLVKVMEYHKNHLGQSAAEADFSLLDIARRLEMYGIRLHPARNSDDVLVHIAVNQHGISVFQHFQKSNSFSFSKVRKLSFKKKVFIIKLLQDAVSTFNQSTIEYHMTSRNACKRFWKDCIEHHAFFRLPHNEHTPRPPPSVKILQSGSSFRYAGRTQREMAEQVRNTNQARLQVRRPNSAMAAPISKTLPAKTFEAAPATAQMTPGTPGSMQGVQMLPGGQMVPSTMPPKRPDMDPNIAMMHHQQQQQQQQMLHGSMQQLQQHPAAAIAPFNRMSATSPLPQQLIAGTPLLNRSATPLNDGSQPMRPQMIPLAMSNQGLNQMGMQLLSPGSDPSQQMLQQQQQQTPQLPPNSYHPQLPPHLTKQYHPEVGISGEVIQENESDHDYENYPVNGEGQNANQNQTQNAMLDHVNPQHPGVAMVGGQVMMRPSSRQRDSLANSEDGSKRRSLLGQRPINITNDSPNPQQQQQQFGPVPESQSGDSDRTHDSVQLSNQPSIENGEQLPPHLQQHRNPALNSPRVRTVVSPRPIPHGDLNTPSALSPLSPLAREPPVSNIPRDNTSSSNNDFSLASNQADVLNQPQLRNSRQSPIVTSSNNSLQKQQLTQEALRSSVGGQPQQMVNGGRTRRDSDNSSSLVVAPTTLAQTAADDDAKRRRVIAGKSYYLAKEIVSTERTYLKDLDVITVGFRSAVQSSHSLPGISELHFFNCFSDIADAHTFFLKEIENRINLWDGGSKNTNAPLKGDYQRVGDVLLRHVKNISASYESFLSRQVEIMSELESNIEKSSKFEECFKEFEQQKMCYLPFTAFLLKPSQRLLHYEFMLKKLLQFYPQEHRDFADCKAAMECLSPLIQLTNSSLVIMEHNQKLAELQRDLLGVKNLMSDERRLVREGSLYKQSKSRNRYQQRMFFLFSDVLLYSSLGVTSTNQFRVHGRIDLINCSVSGEGDADSAYTFTLHFNADSSVVLAASSDKEKELWMNDLRDAIQHCTQMNIAPQSLVIDSSSDSKTGIHTPLDGGTSSHIESGMASETQESEEEGGGGGPGGSGPDKVSYHRSNTTMHVCWHRQTSVSMNDHIKSVHNQLSGYLLRKFKNSNGWQKLWVVFTNFCLFFYKTYHDDFPLASLPLLGYCITMPEPADNIQKDYVFKLQFKTHVYFFRAESQYTFNRWLEVIGCATNSSN
ncbi:FERM, ARHGEF and pleckstrin domain-containing protein 1-like isoform X2 [Convolutriloba macropyga]|uniref:FERM, ARHGEF and pleckstrin domain-containing protein 1-like isoform X2 n=1 Tax=Convolutriloba macropyga TaxID=536237 RepID=UPI003F527B29